MDRQDTSSTQWWSATITGDVSSRTLRRVLAVLLVHISASLQACRGGSPTTPTRYGPPLIILTCATAGAVTTQCQATISCSLYSCRPGTPSDVTEAATWTVDDTAIAAVIGPGTLKSVGTGHTLVRAAWNGISMFRPIGVFPGTAPLPTYEYEGMIWDGAASTRTPLNGALVEVLDGIPAGRTTLSGGMPDSYPGAIIVQAAGHYAFFGIPSGTYRLRVSRDGYAMQEVVTQQFADVTLLPNR